MEHKTVQDVRERLRAEVHRVVVGQDAVIDLMFVALLCEGHVVLEGVPGTAKTLLAQSFAAALAMPFKRLQFTPDLMPGDVIGTNVYDFQTSRFVLTRGPVFTSVLLADEINRTPPKTQSALLQAMQERAVTIDGATHDLGAGFMVIATQNPLEQEGTYPLPEAQLDRFLFKAPVGYPSAAEEREMVRLHGHRTAMPRLPEFHLSPVADLAFLLEERALLSTLRMTDEVVVYVVELARATRQHPALLCGASPRAASMLATAARAQAVIEGRDYVLPDDVKALIGPAFGHRMVLSPGSEVEGTTIPAVVQQIVDQVPAPR
ncbi:MAG TPA: MoxR family ATPase [Vicinamibacteria bacterium]